MILPSFLKRCVSWRASHFTNSTGKPECYVRARFINFGAGHLRAWPRRRGPMPKRIRPRRIVAIEGLAQEVLLNSPLYGHQDFRCRNSKVIMSAPDRAQQCTVQTVCCPHRFEMSSVVYTEQAGTSASGLVKDSF